MPWKAKTEAVVRYFDDNRSTLEAKFVVNSPNLQYIKQYDQKRTLSCDHLDSAMIISHGYTKTIAGTILSFQRKVMLAADHLNTTWDSLRIARFPHFYKRYVKDW